MENNQEDYNFFDAVATFAGSYFGVQSANQLKQAPKEQAALASGTPQPNNTSNTASSINISSNALLFGFVGVVALVWMSKGAK